MTVPKDIKRLVERFRENREVHCSCAHSGTQAAGTGWCSRPQLEKLLSLLTNPSRTSG